LDDESKDRIRQLLTHILDAICKIETYTEQMNQAEFSVTSLTQDAVVRNLEIIGEASNSISKKYPSYAESNKDIPFSLAYEMRNVLTHGYFQVDYDVVWVTIKNDIPKLKKAIEEQILNLS
jgi:uncharacterized protein with HEPN domain